METGDTNNKPSQKSKGSLKDYTKFEKWCILLLVLQLIVVMVNGLSIFGVRFRELYASLIRVVSCVILLTSLPTAIVTGILRERYRKAGEIAKANRVFKIGLATSLVPSMIAIVVLGMLLVALIVMLITRPLNGN